MLTFSTAPASDLWSQALGRDLPAQPLDRGDARHGFDLTIVIADHDAFDHDELLPGVGSEDSTEVRRSPLMTLFPTRTESHEARVVIAELTGRRDDHLLVLLLLESTVDVEAWDSTPEQVCACVLRSRDAALGRVRDSDTEVRTLDWLSCVAPSFTGHLDRLINYVNFDDRMYDVARSLARKLAELKLKCEVAYSGYNDWVGDPNRGAILDEWDEPLLEWAEPTDEQVAYAFWEAEYKVVEGRRRRIERDYRTTQTHLEVAGELSRTLTDEATARTERSVNMVLYWLGIVTLAFGVVGLYDKYLSSDNSGLDWGLAFQKTLTLVLVLTGFFLLAMIRHGTLLKGVGAFLRRMEILALDLVIPLLWYLPGGMGLSGRIIGKRWESWLEWNIVRLTDGELAALFANLPLEANESLEAMEQLERRSNRRVRRIWSDLELKYGAHLDLQMSAASSFSVQSRRLRLEILLDAYTSLLWLDVPQPCPSILAYTTFVLRMPGLAGTSAAMGWKVTRSPAAHRRYLESYADLLLNNVISADELHGLYKEAIARLFKPYIEEADTDELWAEFEREMLGLDPSGAIPDCLIEIDEEEIDEAFEKLTVVALAKECHRRGGNLGEVESGA